MLNEHQLTVATELLKEIKITLDDIRNIKASLSTEQLKVRLIRRNIDQIPYSEVRDKIISPDKLASIADNIIDGLNLSLKELDSFAAKLS